MKSHAVCARFLISAAFVSAVGCGSSINASTFDNPSGETGGDTPSNGDAFEGRDSSAKDTGTVAFDTAPLDTFDPNADKDGDGYKAIDDCNDDAPLINPGAYDYPGDGIDNDCSGKADDEICDDAALTLDSTDAKDFAKAMGICRTTTADAMGKARTWGLIAARITRADGTSAPKALQHGILKSFGKNVSPLHGKSFALLSSGTARTPDSMDWVKPSPGFADDTNVTPAPSGFPRNAAGCPAITKTSAYDGIALELELRVPTNAKGFKVAHDFYTSEYVAQVCKGFDDHFLVLLQSGAPLDAKYSGNIVFDAMGEHITSSTSLLDVCTPGMAAGKSWACTQGTKELEGTGFADVTKPTNGAATGWLDTHARVVAAETMKVRFVIFDVGDHLFDSSVLLDGFRWTLAGPDLPATSKAAK